MQIIITFYESKFWEYIVVRKICSVEQVFFSSSKFYVGVGRRR